MVERELILLIEKEEKEIPRQKRQETSEDYRQRLLQVFVLFVSVLDSKHWQGLFSNEFLAQSTV
jgi:hypothetical protein